MSRVMIIGDTHFGLSRKGKSNYYLENQINFFKSYVIKRLNSIDYIIFLGDIFDNRKSIDIFVLKRIKEEIFNRIKKKIYIILGNHDIYFNETTEFNSPSVLLSEYDNITVIDYPTVIDNNLLLMPWLINSEEKIDTYKNLLKKSVNYYVFGHFEIKEFMPQDKKTLLELKDFKNNKLVFSGHIHKSMIRSNVIYTSTPYDIDWGDVSDEKGIFILDTITGEYQKIINKDRLYKVINYDDIENINIKDISNKIVKVIVNREYDKKDLNIIREKCKYCLDYQIIKNVSKNEMINNIKDVEICKMEDISKFVINKLLDLIPESKPYLEQICHG